ncbi:flagellar FlbD family protein [Liquorilactobacillus sicerae]|uniref:flagellar FlbD family protein n=1 Tax=Liquorilactobacillus sicerae TaxID=1416943 RepID=UPI002481078F|nr:flagellar FlbD family protein [Liquorilactobacillus sicerae]
MIELTSLNGSRFYLNPDLIYRVEQVPDTTVTLTTGKVLVVKEKAIQIRQLIIDYRHQILVGIQRRV